MAETTASLIIKVDSSGAKSATADLDRLTAASDKAETATGGLTNAWRALKGVLTVAAVTKVTRAYIDAADSAANMAAKLKLVTGSVEAAAKAQRDLFALSQRNSADLESTTELYVKLGQSSKELAGNHELLLDITDKVSKALVISGADAASASAVIRQFSQAMAAGSLRGDEFISVMEGAPRLARAIAEGMGVSVGALRGLAAEGKLTSDAIIAALENQGAVLDREFGEMPLTVSRATQQVRNALLQLVGDTEGTTGATRDLARAIADLARTLESDEFKRGFANAIDGANGLTQAMLSTGGAADRLRGLLAGLELQGNAAFQSLNPMNWTSGGLARLSAQYRRGAGFAENGWSAMQPSATVGVPIPDGMRSGPRGRRTRATEAEVAATAGYGKTVSSELQKELDKIKEQAQAYGLSRLELAKLNQEKALAAAKNDTEREAIRGAYGELIKSIEADEKATAGKKASTEAAEKQKRAIEELARAYDGYLDRLNRGIALHGQDTELARLNYEIQYGALKGIKEEQAAILREAAQWRDWQEESADIYAAIEQSTQATSNEMVERQRRATDEMSEFTRQAARNMQSSFADFLFDPFENGVSGMVRGFATALRRMAAELAASKVFEMLSQWGAANAGAGGWVGAIAGALSGLGGQKAAGGPVQAGQGYIVGDGGKPELFVPGQSGRILPMQPAAAAAPPVINITVEKGAERDEVKQSRGPGGSLDIRVLVTDLVRNAWATGEFDQVAQQRHGVRARGVAHG